MGALAVGCSAGGVTHVGQSQDQSYQYQAPTTSGGTGFGGSSSGGSSSSSGGSASSGDSTGTGGTGLPPITTRVGTIGYNSVTFEVDVRAVLKIKFAPGIQDEVVQGTGYSPSYSHLGVYIQVGTKTQATEMLSNGLLDGKPQKSSAIDFSKAFTATCDPMDDTCHQPVTIKVFKPNNDYFCMNFGMYCNWANVYETHPWHGTLYIQTDDTDAI
jgi:hypothetical protein